MKKLMVMIAAAATAVGAFAEGVWQTGTSFSTETQLEAAQPLSSTTIQELVDGAGYWSANLPDTVQVSLFGSETPPDAMDRFKKKFAHENYLTVKTTLGEPIWRNVLGDGTAKEVDANAAVYFEGNVRFTAFDQAPDLADEDYAGAKIALFVQDHTEAETDAKAETNLYVAVGSTIYECGDASALVDNWAKLTIKAMQITAGGQLGFIIYVNDGAITAENIALPENMTAVAKVYAQQKKLFPSAVTSGNMKSTLTAIGFDGQGALDQIAFTDEDLYPNPECFTISWDETITSVALDHGTTLAEPAVNGGAYAFGQETWKYTYVAADGYISVITPTLIEGNLELTADPLVASGLIDGVETQFSTVEDMLTAINGASKTAEVTLASPIEAEEGITLGKDGVQITIDLAGNAISSTTAGMPAITVSAGMLTINDSSELQTGTVQGASDYENGAVALYTEEAEITINAGTFIGDASSAYAFTGGKFSYLENSMEGECMLSPDNLPDGKIWVVDDEQNPQWWVLGDEPITTYALTVVEDANATFVLTVNGEPVNVFPAQVEAGATIVLTATAKEDYKYAEGANVIETEMPEEALELTVPAPTAKVYVAQIGSDGAKFESLADAIAGAVADNTIKLIAQNDVTTTADNMVIFDKNLTLDLNGQVLTVAVGGENQFGTAENVTVSLTDTATDKGKITITTGSYGIKVAGGATLNVACRIERTSESNPVFDIYGGTVNCGEYADIFSKADIFRFEKDNLESTVKITGGKYENEDTSDNSRCIFHHYKAGHTANITITGGDFTFKNHLIDAYAETGKDDPILKFAAFDENSTVRFSYTGSADPWVISSGAVAEGKILAEGCEIVADPDREGWFMVAKAASPIIDPTDPESKQTVEAKDADDAIAKAEVGVPEAAKGIVEPADYKAYFNFTAIPAGEGKFEVAINGLKADVVEAPTTADLVANFDEIGEDGLTVVAKPGLFYGVKQAAAVDGVAAAKIATEGTGLATSTEVKLPVAKQGDAGFYKVVVDVKPFDK